MSLYRAAFLVGRFQLLHKGHEDMINTALALADRTAIFIGSSQESLTAKNPFSFEERRDMICAVYGSRAEIYPLPDLGVGNVPAWGQYVLDTAAKCLGEAPDVFVSGKERRRSTWFDEETGATVAELYIPKRIPISSTQIKQFLYDDDREHFSAYVHENLHGYYDFMRSRFISCRNERDTSSV